MGGTALKANRLLERQFTGIRLQFEKYMILYPKHYGTLNCMRQQARTGGEEQLVGLHHSRGV